MTDSTSRTLTEYFAWDKTTRWFHWINVICVLALMAIGTVILNGSTIGLSGEGKVLLKTVHVLTGYVFLTNLVWRLIWAFIGTANARWNSLLPFRTSFTSRLKAYIAGSRAGTTPEYIGHNPLGRLMVTFLLALLIVQGTTGIILAGTDIYFPPFGGTIAEWVTGGDPEKLANLAPGSKDFVDLEKYNEMRAFRKPVITTHLYVFYTLLVAIFIHILAVVVTDIRERSGIISAMFTGRKVLSKPPVDQDETADE
jgi:cytochrome b